MRLTPAPLIQAAKARVRERLQLRANGSSSEHAWPSQRALAGAARVAALIGVDRDSLRPEDRVREALRVARAEMSDTDQASMSAFGVPGSIDPFAFDLLALVEKRVAEDRSRLRYFQPAPGSEADWLERINEMTMAELSEVVS